MNIIQKKWEFLNSTAVHIPKQAKQLYGFGLTTLTARSIESLRSNARLLSLNWNTAKSKAYRLTKNTKLIPFFLELLARQSLVHESDVVAVDFSDFGNDFQVLMFAKQTAKGRALPLYFEPLQYPIQKDSQNTFVIETIKHLTDIIHCTPTLVFDRGFACPSIITFLKENHYFFVIRIKGGKHVQTRNGRTLAARDMQRNDAVVRAYGQTFRLIVSDVPENGSEPWYLVTNDLRSSREEVIRIYYHRFEIEEFFRDAKRLLGLEWVNCKRAQTLSVVLWFVILGIWCLVYLETLLEEHHETARRAMRLSKVRFIFEQLQAACFSAAEGRYCNALYL